MHCCCELVSRRQREFFTQRGWISSVRFQHMPNIVMNSNFFFKSSMLPFANASWFELAVSLSREERDKDWYVHVWVPPRLPTDHLLLDRSPNIGPFISHWELDKFKNCWDKSCRTSKILTLLYEQLLNLLISQQDISGPILGDLSNNRWSWGNFGLQKKSKCRPWDALFLKYLVWIEWARVKVSGILKDLRIILI
jgi:hypothetical protein